MARKYKCYLVCSSVPLLNRGGTVKVSHYVGTTNREPEERLADHIACGENCTPHTDRDDRCKYDAARITAAFVRAGGTLVITRIWSGGTR